MNDADALKVAKLVDELWSVGRGEVWQTFYASTITSIPDVDSAMAAIKDLFSHEQRYHPTPEALIRASGAVSAVTEAVDQWAALCACADGYGDRKSLTPVSWQILDQLGGWDAIEGPDRETRRNIFVGRYRDRQRRDKHQRQITDPANALPVGPHNHVDLPDLPDLRLDPT